MNIRKKKYYLTMTDRGVRILNAAAAFDKRKGPGIAECARRSRQVKQIIAIGKYDLVIEQTLHESKGWGTITCTTFDLVMKIDIVPCQHR